MVMKNEIFYVCGALRSGSTLLHLMIDNHLKLNNPGEFDFFFDQINKNGEEPSLKYYKSWLGTHRIYNSKGLSFPESAISYSDVLDDFVQQLGMNNKKLILNIHRNFEHIPKYFPDAKYIHLVRDPRDVAKSSISMGWAGNVYFGVKHWLESELSWDKLTKVVKPENIHVLKYEDLVSDPYKTLDNLCKFIGVEFDSMMLNYHENSTYEKLDPSLAFQWKKRLSETEVRLVETKAGHRLKSLSYEMSGFSPIEIGFFYKLLLAYQNKLFRFNFNTKRYGYGLVIKEKFYRNFGMVEKHQDIRVKMNQIELKYVK